MENKHDKTMRIRTKKTSKDGKVTRLYSINRPNTDVLTKRQADLLRDVADEMERGDYGRVHRIAVVMDQGGISHDTAFLDQEGNQRDEKWWIGLFTSVIQNILNPGS